MFVINSNNLTYIKLTHYICPITILLLQHTHTHTHSATLVSPQHIFRKNKFNDNWQRPTSNTITPHLSIPRLVAINVIDDHLIVLVLVVPLVGAVVAEVVPERHEHHVAAVQLGFLPPLVQYHERSVVEPFIISKDAFLCCRVQLHILLFRLGQAELTAGNVGAQC